MRNHATRPRWVPTLSRSVCVMEFNSQRIGHPLVYADDPVWFFGPDEDNPGQFTRELAFSVNDFIDMGSPQRITVTIEPGDRLNPT